MREEDLIQHSKLSVTSADVDIHSRLRLGSLVSMLIQAAILNADNLGFDHQKMLKHNHFWVLNRLTLKIQKTLRWYDEIEVSTWPKGIKKLFYLRDFEVKTQKDIVAKGTSSWLAINPISKRPGKVEYRDTEYFERLKNKHAIAEFPHKVDPINDGEASQLTPRYFDFDMNKHVTSSRYIDWMMDSLSMEFHKNHYPKELSINFLKEVLPDESVIVFSKPIDDFYLFSGINKDSGTAYFSGHIIF